LHLESIYMVGEIHGAILAHYGAMSSATAAPTVSTQRPRVQLLGSFIG
jgi:hypothetical protein